MNGNTCKANHETKEAWVRRYGRDAGEIRRRRGVVLAAVLLAALVLTVCGGGLAAASWNRLLCIAGAAAQEGMGQELTDWLVQRDSAALREQGAQLLANSGYAGALRMALVRQIIWSLLGVGAALAGAGTVRHGFTESLPVGEPGRQPGFHPDLRSVPVRQLALCLAGAGRGRTGLCPGKCRSVLSLGAACAGSRALSVPVSGDLLLAGASFYPCGRESQRRPPQETEKILY